MSIPKVSVTMFVAIVVLMLAGLPPDAVGLVLVMGLAFMLDFQIEEQKRLNKALTWIVDHVSLVDKPIQESDAPEALKKLVKKEEDKR